MSEKDEWTWEQNSGTLIYKVKVLPLSCPVRQPVIIFSLREPIRQTIMQIVQQEMPWNNGRKFTVINFSHSQLD